MIHQIRAHAKINLTLDVLGNLPDGYHEVKTVMQALDLHDILEFSEGTTGVSLSSDRDIVPIGPENLVYKAAMLLLENAGLEGKVHIHISKRIPVSAGLGGGSSDAAAALVGLNRYWELGFSIEDLMNIGSLIGADVPFFIMGKTALGTGKGDKLYHLPSPSPKGVILVKPYFGVSTAQVYKLFDQLSYIPGLYTDTMIKALERGDIEDIAPCVGNALEPVTAGLYPEIRKIKNELRKAGALGVEMSGSGPTVFGLAASKEEADNISRSINLPDCEILITETSS